jgi:aminoglycoside phosphotransferase (APT) family kinase protein
MIPEMRQDPFHDIVVQILKKEFGSKPDRITRMGNGICNEVYAVDAGGRDCIVRLNTEARYMLGSHNHIPIFRSIGIRVPEILAEDYSAGFVPVAYQVLSRIEGRDINDVIDTLTDDQLRAIAGEISNVFRGLRDVPNDGRYGVLWGDGDDLVESWTADIAHMNGVVIGWGARSGVLDADLEHVLARIIAEYKDYFDAAEPVTYFGDICAKNVMIDSGRFAGLVDLDSLAQGDPLEAIGRIKASWHGTRHGRVYSEAVMDAQMLSADERRLVTMYALLNRTYWTLENGIQFNQNTSATVDRVRERQDKADVQSLYKELFGTRV